MSGLDGWDLEWFRRIHIGLHRDWLDPVFWLLSCSGLGYVQGILMVPLTFWRGSRPLFVPLLANLVVFGVGSDILKVWVPRLRPSNLPFALPQESVFQTPSFPSGHSTTSFGIAAFLILELRGTRYAWVGWLALAWACMVGFSRVYRGVHWPTDVLAGASLGIFGGATTYLATSWLRRSRQLKSEA